MVLKQTVIFVLLVFLAPVLMSCESNDEGTLTQQTSYEEELFQAINEHRKSKGLEPLGHNKVLYDFAQEHVDYMIEQQKISHDNWDNRTDAIWEELGGGALAENVAMGYSSTKDVVNGWLNSEGHRKNIEGEYTATGLVARQDDNGVYYYCQIFMNF